MGLGLGNGLGISSNVGTAPAPPPPTKEYCDDFIGTTPDGLKWDIQNPDGVLNQNGALIITNNHPFPAIQLNANYWDSELAPTTNTLAARCNFNWNNPNTFNANCFFSFYLDSNNFAGLSSLNWSNGNNVAVITREAGFTSIYNLSTSKGNDFLQVLDSSGQFTLYLSSGGNWSQIFTVSTTLTGSKVLRITNADNNSLNGADIGKIDKFELFTLNSAELPATTFSCP